MPLLTFNIENSLKNQIDSVINSSDYPTLKSYILDRKPIPLVCQPVFAELNILCSQDKEQFSRQATQDSCDLQEYYDAEAFKKDACAKIQDALLGERLATELQRLQAQIFIKQHEQGQQQNNLMQMKIQMGLYSVSLATIQTSLSGVQKEIRTLEEKLSEVRTTDEEHTTPLLVAPHRHRHYHALPDHTVSEQTRLEGLRAEAQRIASGKNALEQTIQGVRGNISHMEYLVKTSTGELTQLTRECEATTTQLQVTLPNQSHQREARATERFKRAQARTHEDSHLEQLEPKNLVALRQRITLEHRQLDDHKLRLEAETASLSHALYLRELEKKLAAPGLKLSDAEYATLKNLIDLFKQCLGMEATFSRLSADLAQHKIQLSSLLKTLNENRTLLNNLPAANDLLLAGNARLSEQNMQLTAESHDFRYKAKKAYVATGVQAVVGALNAGLFYGFSIAPLYFYAIPGALGLGGVIAVSVALVYRDKAVSALGKIGENDNTIQAQNTRIEQQNRQVLQLRRVTIPTHENEIARTQTTIDNVTKQLNAHQEQMQALWQRMKSEVPTPSGAASAAQGFGSFFSPSAPYEAAVVSNIMPPSYAAATTQETSGTQAGLFINICE
ncbi:MAG: hypothetical protein ACHP65_05935 [Legionellales bacterium]